jgi:hypothetical protein
LKNLFRTIFKNIGLLLLVAVLVGTTAFLWNKYSKYLWVPEQPYHELNVGMKTSDVYFRKGEPSRCSEGKDFCIWGEKGDYLIVTFKDGKATYINKLKNPFGYSPPFENVEEMYDILGEEDILSVSKDMISRRYTYLEWGFTFGFEKNQLVKAGVGEVTWRKTQDVSEYYVKGKLVCPSETCPFDAEGKVKPEYNEKSFKDFL